MLRDHEGYGRKEQARQQCRGYLQPMRWTAALDVPGHQDREDYQDGDGADVDEHLDDGQELRPQ